jgi:hypothetical protein
LLNIYEEETQDFSMLSAEREVLGTSLSALYQVATCHRKCFGGGHVLESLSGRIYNLAGNELNHFDGLSHRVFL